MLCRRARNRSRPGAGRRLAGTALSLAACGIAFAAAAAPAGAEDSIEGIWSFNGGAVGIQSQGGGTYQGTVVAPTKFADCPHEVGEPMWTAIRRKPDGSYWGLHQWYFDIEGKCVPTPSTGPTAWRVLSTAGGERYLRVCFSEPGSDMQPTIASGGDYADTTYGCADSARIAPLPTGGLGGVLSMRTNRRCLFSHRKLRIHILNPVHDPLREVSVTLRSGDFRREAKLIRRPSGVLARLSLGNLPTRRFVVRIELKTVLGRRLSRKRSYMLCAMRRGMHGPRRHG